MFETSADYFNNEVVSKQSDEEQKWIKNSKEEKKF